MRENAADHAPAPRTAETESEIWKLMELYASVVRGENTGDWIDEDRQHLETLIKS